MTSRRQHASQPGDQATQPADDLRIINEFALSLLGQNSLEDLLWIVTEKIGTVLGFEDCVLYLVEDGALVQRAAYGVKNPKARLIADPIVIPIGDGIVGGVAATGRGRVVHDTSLEPNYIPDRFCGQSELAVPIAFEGRVLGIIDSECSRVGGYTDADFEKVEWIANIAASRIASALAARDRVIAQENLRLANESLEERVREGTERLAEALKHAHRATLLESVGRLAGGIAHDLNNLLTEIRGSIDLAKNDLPEGTGARADLADAEDGCRRAEELPRRLLALTEGGRPALRTTDSIGDLVGGAVQFALRGSNIAARLSIPDSLPAVEVDTVQITTVLHNLVLNARQAMPGGGSLHVTGRAVEATAGDRSQVEFVLRDEGVGVPERHRSRIFDPYFTTHEDSTGLGLTIAQSVMERHGGQLRLEASGGAGTAFVLRLPTAAAAATTPTASPRTPTPRGVEILIMDDEPGIRRVLTRMLEHEGHRVTATSSGDEALLAFHQREATSRPFDIAFLDLTVPGGMGGLKTLEAMHRSVPDFPAIVMSGYSRDGVVADAPRHGFRKSLAKPFDVDQVLTVLHDVLGIPPDAGT